MSIAAQKRNESPEYLAKLSLAQLNSTEIEVFDITTNTSTKYHAIRAAARALNIDKRYIEQYIYLNQDKPVLDKYTFKLLSDKEKPLEKIQKTSINLEVINIDTKQIKIYNSIGAAARDLGCYQASISLCLKENRTKPFKGKYLFKILKDN